MKNILIFCISFFLFFHLDSKGQSVNAMFQTGKWYFVKKDLKTKTTTYSHELTKDISESIEFKNDSVMIRCGLKCDSARIYKIKMDVLKTRLPKQNYEYFKYCFMGKYLQLTPINP